MLAESSRMLGESSRMLAESSRMPGEHTAGNTGAAAAPAAAQAAAPGKAPASPAHFEEETQLPALSATLSNDKYDKGAVGGPSLPLVGACAG